MNSVILIAILEKLQLQKFALDVPLTFRGARDTESRVWSPTKNPKRTVVTAPYFHSTGDGLRSSDNERHSGIRRGYVNANLSPRRELFMKAQTGTATDQLSIRVRQWKVEFYDMLEKISFDYGSPLSQDYVELPYSIWSEL